jgi:hypothetical protein
MKKIILFIAILPVWGQGGFAQNLDVIGNINTKGKIQINGNSGTAGQVLMSNGAAAPAWTTVSNSTCAVGGKFLMTTTNQTAASGDFDNALNAPTSQSVTVEYAAVQYNTNTDVSIVPSTGIITCNRTGLYHFEGMIRYFVNSPQSQLSRAMVGYKINAGTVIRIDDVSLLYTGLSGSNNAHDISIPFTITRYLTVGQTINFTAELNHLDTNPAIPFMGILAGSFVSGYFMTE